MELIVFDLDGTLLNRDSRISTYTSDTLKLLSERGIAYTVATGRTLHGARAVLQGHRFELPQAYKNGVMIWHPLEERISESTTLTPRELENIVSACRDAGLAPFVFAMDEGIRNTVYHGPLNTGIERDLMGYFGREESLRTKSVEELDADATVTHVNAIGKAAAISAVVKSVDKEDHLVAYSGVALEGDQYRWLDVHHSDASKGGAITTMKKLLGLERVICFGDSENDLSMFESADESYAPENARETIRSAATAVIGHHDEDGIARFLRERFELDQR